MPEKRVRSAVGKLVRGHRFRVLAGVLVLIVIGLGLLTPVFERGAVGARVKTEWDGVYFAVTTVTGVGYGDMVPVTGTGRVIAMILQTVGVVLFGSIVAMVAVALLRYQEDFYVRRMLTRMDELEFKLDEIKRHLDFLVKK
ncbi:MAG: potassium channel family protein [bacterium]